MGRQQVRAVELQAKNGRLIVLTSFLPVFRRCFENEKSSVRGGCVNKGT